MGSSQLEPSGRDVIRDHMGEAPGLPERQEVEPGLEEAGWIFPQERRQNPDTGSTAPGYSVWGSGVLKFCRLPSGR